jgi:predicted MPP superfamily phosphohydrolase
MGWLGYQAVRSWGLGRRTNSAVTLAALALCAGATWARFIEPNTLQVRETTLGSACGVKVALISDLHMGLYMREADMLRLVDRLNSLKVDAVLVAGDWTYEPSHDLRRIFAPMAGVKHPVLSVLGNHDEERPGPPLKQELLAALAAAHVESIDGRRVPLGQCELEGLGDLYAHSAERHLQALSAQPSHFAPDHRVVLAHNPDTAFLLKPGYAATLLAAHTHGGQIDLPFFTARLLAGITRGGFRRGVYQTPTTRLFVTSGVGIDKLPMRFRVPPTIDVLGL